MSEVYSLPHALKIELKADILMIIHNTFCKTHESPQELFCIARPELLYLSTANNQ